MTSDDFSRICLSLSCYAAQLGCGSVTATLGLCIPYFAARFNVECTDLAILLTLSGLGYFLGVQAVSKLLDPDDLWYTELSRFVLLCLSAAIAGAMAFLLIVAGNLLLVKILIFLQVCIVEICCKCLLICVWETLCVTVYWGRWNRCA